RVHTVADLDLLAARLAKNPYQPVPEVPGDLAGLTYDEYINIAFRHDRGMWWTPQDQLPFWLESFHRGFVQQDRVDLFVREDGRNFYVPFSADDFRYDKLLSKSSIDLKSSEIRESGHAGIKIAGKFPGGSIAEIVTFLGASYFRARTEHTFFGSSARGLAIDAASHLPEEFPAFTCFWVQRPREDDKALRVLALLDGPSVTGAYQFDITPGDATTTLVIDAKLHARRDIKKLGIAPITSMWMWGDGLVGPAKDFRPGVHDSDGLLINTLEKGWLWRPFSRQAYPSVSQFPAGEILGFGVMQRNTAFYHYDDHNAHYERRPSIYVTPLGGDWTDGRVELFELPGAHEGIDNIAAFWVPGETLRAGESRELQYRLEFLWGTLKRHNQLARATALSIKRLDSSGENAAIGLELRFHGAELDKLPPKANLETNLVTIRGELVGQKVQKTDTGDWLVELRLRPTEDAPIELRVQLSRDGLPVSEEVAYLLPNKEPSFIYPDVYTRTEQTSAPPEEESERAAARE
ncbi:MAG: glucan biosynthesis protein, partial [Planctomycetota bacterium]